MHYFDEDETDQGDQTDDSQRSELTNEAGYICDSCGEEIVVPLDYSEGQSQKYVEDCPVCCNPNVIFVEFDPDGEARVSSRAEQDPR